MNDNGHQQLDYDAMKAAIQNADSATTAFKTQDQNTALNLIMQQADEFTDNAFRLDIPNNKVAVCIPFILEACEENGYKGGVKIIKEMAGLMASVRGKRVGILSDTIIGERRWQEGVRGQSFWNKAKNFIGGSSD